MSERIEQDMRLALNVHDKGQHQWTENLVVREWHDIDMSQEWRCFVKNRKLTAISQYNYLPHFPELLEHRDYLHARISSFVNDVVMPMLPAGPEFDDAVVDVAITGDAFTNPTMWVIELNPFLSSTDGALFSWSHDLALLTGADGAGRPAVLRLQEHRSSDGLRVQMNVEWRDKLDSIDIDSV